MTDKERMYQSYQKDPEKFRRRRRAWHKNNPIASARIAANYKLKKRYGITIEQKEELLAIQNGLCALCLCNLPILSKAAVDHDHKTGRIRGILCIGCNRAMGRLGDSWETLERVSMYLAAASMGLKYMADEDGGVLLC